MIIFKILFALIVVTPLIMSCNDGQSDKKSTSKTVHHEISKVALFDLNDQPVRIDTFEGKTIFLNFWATWCKPCITEMPGIKNAKDLIEKQGIVFILASNEPVEQIKEFQESNNYHFQYVRVANIEQLYVQGLPTTYIYNPKGQLAFAELGSRNWDDSSNIDLILRINKQK